MGSRASNLLITTSLFMVVMTLIIVYSPIGLAFFEFVNLPPWFLAIVLGIVGTHFLLVESLKHVFFSRYEVYL